MLGSVHALKKDFYPLNKKVEESFDKSDVLVVEVDINDVGGLCGQTNSFPVQSAFRQREDIQLSRMILSNFRLLIYVCIG